MATIRAYTTIEQSRKLAEFLPLESADMHYNNESIKGANYVDEYRAELMDYNTAQKVLSLSKHLVNPMFEIVPCWSLASLFDVMPKNQGGKPIIALDDNYITYPHISNLHTKADNIVDACYEMIIKLNELNLL